MATVIEGDFEWDTDKAAANLVKHGISFAEATTVFADPLAVYLDDGSGTDRMVVIGASVRERTLFVVHVELGSATGSSAPARPPARSGPSMNREVDHEPGSQEE